MDTSTSLTIYTANSFKQKFGVLIGFRYLEYDDSINAFYYALEYKNKVVGVLKEKNIVGYTYDNTYIEDMLTIMYITIKDEYKNQGFAKQLLEKYFKHRRNYKIHLSPYSKEGYKYLRNKIKEIALKNNVEIISKDYCYEC